MGRFGKNLPPFRAAAVSVRTLYPLNRLHQCQMHPW